MAREMKFVELDEGTCAQLRQLRLRKACGRGRSCARTNSCFACGRLVGCPHHPSYALSLVRERCLDQSLRYARIWYPLNTMFSNTRSSMSRKQRAREKEAFFDELYALDDGKRKLQCCEHRSCIVFLNRVFHMKFLRPSAIHMYCSLLQADMHRRGG